MELSLRGSGITYEPGDVVGIRCPNPASATEFLLRRLQVGLTILLLIYAAPFVVHIYGVMGISLPLLSLSLLNND